MALSPISIYLQTILKETFNQSCKGVAPYPKSGSLTSMRGVDKTQISSGSDLHVGNTFAYGCEYGVGKPLEEASEMSPEVDVSISPSGLLDDHPPATVMKRRFKP
ncbi:hypothetical protein NPIL_297791 [Nephila pilipes]|uniref:Uncharacterized protein n=1 Tax=Nephila pilipes TaxID=299642 RepID=A0A8X6P575_NEPPI|nr:hypothetical protein NPIL_297791 [Nephila pilipes]